MESTWTMFHRRLMQFRSRPSSIWKQWHGSETKRTIACPAPTSKAKTDEGEEEKSGKTSSNRRARFRPVTKIVKKNSSCKFGILACVRTTSLRLDANMEEHVSLDMLRPRKNPTKCQRKVVQRISCNIEEVYTIGLCISRFLSEKIFCT